MYVILILASRTHIQLAIFFMLLVSAFFFFFHSQIDSPRQVWNLKMSLWKSLVVAHFGDLSSFSCYSTLKVWPPFMFHINSLFPIRLPESLWSDYTCFYALFKLIIRAFWSIIGSNLYFWIAIIPVSVSYLCHFLPFY